MKSKILNRLRGAEEFVSGQQLCEEFGVSRTAVWKAINQLKEEGYEIEAVHNKGYRLLGCPDIISAEEVKSRLHTDWAGCEVRYFDTLDSTNICAKRMAEEGAPNGTLVIADKQTAGRGRCGQPRGKRTRCSAVAELERMRASLLAPWWNHSMRTEGAKACSERAKPRPPLLLSTAACRVSERRSIPATSGSVTSIGSRE